MTSFLPRKRRDRALLVVGATIASAAVLIACSETTNTEGPVGNLAPPEDSGQLDGGRDVLPDTVNTDGPVGNLAPPEDTGSGDTSDAGGDGGSDARDGTSDADGG